MVRTLPNQNPASSACKACEVCDAHMAHKVRKVVGKKSGFYANEVVQFH